MIYLDNAATTKPNENALVKAAKFNNEFFYNPSALYREGLFSAKEIKSAKENILKNIKAMNHELIFTSGGTESDNLAIFGAVSRGNFITDKGEHSAVYNSFLQLKNKGNKVEFIDVNSDGTVNTEKLFDYVKNNTVDFVSIVHVNNETGGINDINFIAKTLKTINPKIIFHSDGVQAYGKINYKISNDIDLYSISSHKINGLKGTGALIKKKGLHLSPIIFGGGQEGGFRSGTENVFGIKVFEYASEERYNNLSENFIHVSNLNKLIREDICKDVFTVISSKNASPYILTISAKGLKGEVVMHSLEAENIIVGNGSACSSKSRFSRVISACGYDESILDGVVRISFSPDNKLEEIYDTLDALTKVGKRLKGIMR